LRTPNTLKQMECTEEFKSQNVLERTLQSPTLRNGRHDTELSICCVLGAPNHQEWDCSFYSGDGTPCDDGNICTEGDQCSGGTCNSGPIRQCPNDLNQFTEQCIFYECNSQLGGCTASGRRPVGHPCTDFDLCTTNDGCNGFGVCVSTFNSTACPTVSGTSLQCQYRCV
jgi:hypothetical protein